MIPVLDDTRVACFRALADIALDVPMRYFGKVLETEIKHDSSPVTEADKATEQALRECIMRLHKHDGIIGEEFESYQAGADYQWIIDPIDGTKSFITGMPLFGVLVGLLHEGKPCQGMMVMPALRQVFFGNGEKAWYNSEEIKAANETDLGKAYFSLGEANRFLLQYPKAIEIFSSKFGMLRTYHDCYAFGLLSRGYLHGVIETGLQSYDILPLVPIIKGAGGVISDWQNRPLSVELDGTVLASATADLHVKGLDLLATMI